jgi:hypothetical protein
MPLYSFTRFLNMSDKVEGNSFKQAMDAVGGIFSSISKAWSSGDTGAAANSAVAAMSNPAAAAATVASTFDGAHPFGINA